MTRASALANSHAKRGVLGALIVGLCACNLGLGSDPAPSPWPCLPGNVRATPRAQCAVPATTIEIDGALTDWSDVAAVALTSTCIGSPCDGLVPRALAIASELLQPDDTLVLLVRIVLDAAPPSTDASLRVVLSLAASPHRPATRGIDEMIMSSSGVLYEKNDWPTTSPVASFASSWTVDGIELSIADRWLTLQGVAELVVTTERLQAGAWTAIARSEPMTVCWQPSNAELDASCEAPAR